MISLRPATVADGPAIDTLLDACFGPARHARTAYRLREGAAPLAGPSLVAHDGDILVGSVQVWPVALFDDARTHTLTLLGPLAVAPARRCSGIGAMLVRTALARVDAAEAGTVVLIGDAAYYARFGFSAVGTQSWALPGPVDRARLLLRGDDALPRVARLGPVARPMSLAA